MVDYKVCSWVLLSSRMDYNIPNSVCESHLVEFVWCCSNMKLKQQLSENTRKLLAISSCEKHMTRQQTSIETVSVLTIDTTEMRINFYDMPVIL